MQCIIIKKELINWIIASVNLFHLEFSLHKILIAWPQVL